MNEKLYKLLWSPEVHAALRTGGASLMRDRVSGLPLPVAKADQIIGLPRLIEGVSSGVGLGNILTPILSGANLVATGFNIWQTHRLRKEVKQGFVDTQRIVLAGVAAEAQLTRAAVAAEGDLTRAAVFDEAEAVKAHATRWHLATLSVIDAGFEDLSVKVDSLAEQLGGIAAVTAYGILLTARIHETQREGFGAILSSLEDLRTGQVWIVDTLRKTVEHEAKRIANREIKKAAYQLVEVHEVLANLGTLKRRDFKLDRAIDRVQMEVIPMLRTHLDEHRPSAIERVPLVLLVTEAQRTLGLARALNGDAGASKAMRNGFDLANDTLRHLLTEESSPFDFHVNRAPAARLMLSVCDSLRLAEVALSPNFVAPDLIGDPLSATDAPPEPAARVSGTGAVAWPHGSPKGLGLWFQKNVKSSYVSRVLGRRVESDRHYEFTFRDIALHVGVPSSAPEEGSLTQEEANAVGKALSAMADPVSRDVERALLLDAAALVPLDRSAMTSDAAAELADVSGVEFSAADLAAMSEASLLALAGRWRRRHDDDAKAQISEAFAPFRAQTTDAEKRLTAAKSILEFIVAFGATDEGAAGLKAVFQSAKLDCAAVLSKREHQARAWGSWLSQDSVLKAINESLES